MVGITQIDALSIRIILQLKTDMNRYVDDLHDNKVNNTRRTIKSIAPHFVCECICINCYVYFKKYGVAYFW